MKRFVEAFAQSGDKTEVPNTVQGDGSISYPAGYGPDYEKNLDSDPEAKRIERQKMNQLFNDVTTSVKLWQEQGYPMFVSAADNGGASMPYKKGMKVVFADGNIYQSLIDNNDGVPGTDFTKWSQVSGIDGEYVEGGTYKKGEIVTATDGNQYWCNKPNNGTSPVSPINDSTDTWRQYPCKKGSNSNGRYIISYTGDITMFGTVETDIPDGTATPKVKTYNLPLTLPNSGAIFAQASKRTYARNNIEIRDITTTNFKIGVLDLVGTGVLGASFVDWEVRWVNY